MFRVFFDANDGSMELGYFLVFERSLADLNKVGPELREGLRVVIYSPNELEMEAYLRHDGENNMWLGIPVPGTITYLDGSEPQR